VKIAIMANVTKEGIKTIIPDFCRQLEAAGIGAVLDENLLHVVGGGYDFRPEASLFEGVDLIVSFGGDGTILRVAAVSANTGIPILGVNLGKVGFLAEVSPDEITQVIRFIRDSDYEVMERMSFSACIDDGKSYFALNDIVLDRNANTRILEFSVSVNGIHAGDFFADGLIVATPTGSTAHSASAGGPLVMPECSVIILTPICPHSLTLRPMIVDGSQKVRVDVLSGLARMAVDGQSFIDVCPGSHVTVERGPRPVRIARFRDKTYFDILHRRLNWGVTPKMKNA
jgi:NAD+ kinase